MASNNSITHKNNHIRVEGNNGGDFLAITVIERNKKINGIDCDIIELEEGHCCIITLRVQIPVPVLTSLMSKTPFTDLKLEWEEDFSDSLLKNCKKLPLPKRQIILTGVE